MATALAQQLTQLKGLYPQERWAKGKHSLLFDYQRAADVSAESLLGIAQQGIEALCKVDRRFSPFTDSLFSRASLSITRDQLTKAENEQLDTNISAFLRVLVNHFLLPAAFQVLEYCIRRYQVHVYNVRDLLLCALPYHSTPEFARLLSLLQLRGTSWEWLTPCQQSGAPPPRELLVRRCVNDQAVIRDVCKGAESLGAPGFVSKTFLSVYAVLLCEVFTAAPAVTEDLLTVLLPYLVAGLKSSATKEYRAATVIVLTQLLAKAQLGRECLTAMVPEVICSAPDLGDYTAIMLLTHMAASQPELKTLSVKSMQLLVEQCQTGQQLSDLQCRGATVTPLLQLLLTSLAPTLPQNPHLQPLMLDLLNNVTVDSDLVQITAVQLLQAGAAQYQQEQQQQQPQQHTQQVLRVFDLRYPDDLDAAINTALQRASAGTAAVDSSSSKKTPSKHKKHQQQPGANNLFAFIQHAFSGSRHEVVAVEEELPGAPQQQHHQQQALTLSLAVSAPASQMRLMAIQKLDAICSQPDASESTKQLLHTSLISCLRDDSFAVAGAAAAAAGLATVPADLQLPALQHLLMRAADCLTAGHHAAAADGTAATAVRSSSSTKEVVRAATAALSAAAAVGQRAAAAAAEHTSEQQQELLQGVVLQTAALVLEYVLADKRLKKLAIAAATVCCSCQWHPLLQLLSSAPAVAAALQQHTAAEDTPLAGSADSKRRKKSIQAAAAPAGQSAPVDAGKHAVALALNRAVVQTLAEGLTAPGGATVLTECAALASMCGPRCLHLLQLALVKAVSAAAVGKDSAAAAATAVPHTPSGRTRGRSKQQQVSSHVATSSSGSGAATAAQIAVLLLQMLEQQITSPAALNAGSKSDLGSTRLVLPDDWASVAAAALDESSLPTKHHFQQLHCQLPQLQTSVLLAGLRSALASAPVQDLSAVSGPHVQLFGRLAAASAAAGQDTLLPQLELLVSKSCCSVPHQLQFLADIYGLPSGVCSPTVQVAALKIVTVLEATSPTSSSGSDSSWVVQLLAAVNSSSKILREAAVDALLALPTTAAASMLDSFPSSDVSDLVSALQQHEELLRGSAGALTPLLASAVTASSMDVDTAAAAAAGSSGRSTRSKARGSTPAKVAAGSSAAGVTITAITAQLRLPDRCCQALLQLLLTALPGLHNESHLEAAGLAVTVLAASAGVAAVDKAVAAQRLLQQLVQGLLSSSKAPGGANAGEKESDAVWVQLAAMQREVTAVEQAAVQLQQQRAIVADALLQFYTPEALVSPQSKGPAETLAASYISLLQLPFAAPAASATAAGATNAGSSKLSDTQLAAVAPVRSAALQQLDAALFAVLSSEQKQAAFAAALQTHSADGDSDCRVAARSSLEQLPVSADMLLQLLNPVTGSNAPTRPPLQQQQHQSKAKRTRRTSSQAGDGNQQQQQQQEEDVQAEPGSAAAAAAAGGGGCVSPGSVVSAADMDAAVAALELLQWKDDVQDKQQLLQPLQDMIRVTLPLMGTMAETYSEAGDSATAAAVVTSDTFPGPAAAAVSPSVVCYAIQLALSTVESLVREYGMSAGGVDPALVLSCAGAAADGSVRNAALLLLAVLAELAPEDMLEHVLQAMSVIHQSSALSDDSHSQSVASAVLSSLVPAWLSAGRDSGELWGCLISALPGLPATRRLRLLDALLRALPQESGLAVGLLLMMQRVIASTAPAAAAATPDSSKKTKKGKKTPTTAASEEQPVAAAAGVADVSDWMPDLMAALCEKVSVPVRLQSFSRVLSSSLAGPDGSSVPAHHPTPRLAVTFITAHLKARSVLAAARAATTAHGDSTAATIQQACQAIMEQALQHLLQLNLTVATAAAAGSKNSRKTHKAVRAAAAGVYELLTALEAVQACPSYLQALVQMSRHPAESVQRRALKLLAARLLKAQIDLADLESATEQLPAAVQRQQQLAQAGLAICQDLARLLQAQSALTRQLALIAADAGIRQFGSRLPGTVLECLETVLATAGDTDEAAPVRVSALACIASAVTAIGPKLVPLLPQTAAVVLSAAETACKDLRGFDHERQQQQRQQQGSSSSDEEHDNEIDTSVVRSHGEEAALQLTAALAGLEALATTLGPFLSPYLKQILQLLLHQQVLACSTAGGAAAAARLRAALPAQIPPRLLLEPLVSQWDYAVAAGSINRAGSTAATASAEPAAALLGLVAALCSLMEPATAVTYHETVLSLLLRALDTRHRWLAASSGQQEQRPAAADAATDAAAAATGQLDHTGVLVIESAAVKALSALVMKLSESKFKPMFLHMVEWANAGISGAALDTQVLGRAAAFMAVVCMLADKLRAVFIPYFKYFSIMHMKLLAGEGLGSTVVRPKKKHKNAAAAAGPNLGLTVSGWLARLRAVRAVHLLALHAPAAGPSAAVQEQQERFDRLLPLVVEQLADGPSAEVASILVAEGADSALDLPGGPVAALGAAGKAAVEAGGSAVVLDSCDIIGTAAVGALIQVAIAGGSDVVWKPLHHAMLMAARGGSTRAKLLVLGGVSRLAELLREEYLMLLPEALPFISELVEDGEVAVEGAAQGLIAQLEVLSGEKLEQYLKA